MKLYNLSRLTGYYVFIIICVIPLFYLPFSERDAFRLPKFGLWAVSLTVTIIFIFIERLKTKERLKIEFKSNIYILLGIYVLIWIISTLFSVDKMTSIIGVPLYNGLIQLLMYIITFILISNYFQFKLSYIKYVLIVYCLIACICILQFYKIDPLTKHYGTNAKSLIGQAFATIGNQNHVATCLSVVFIIAAFLYILSDEKTKEYQHLYFVAALIIFAGDIATMTRGGWLAIMFTFAAALPYIIKNYNYIKRYMKIIIACLIVMLIIEISSGDIILNRVVSLIYDGKSVAAGEMSGNLGSGRMEIWLNSIELIKRHWLIGSGPDTFILVYNNIDLKAQNFLPDDRNFASNPHNESLRLLITTGIFSLITYWMIVLSIIKTGIKKIKDNKYIIPFLLGLVCYLIKGMLNCSLVTDMIIFWVLLALIYSFKYTDSV